MNETFGQRFQRLRKAVGLTQEEVATKLNITAQAVSKWENDVSAPDISVLPELSEILNVSVDEMLGKTSPVADVTVSAAKKDPADLVFRIKIISSNGDKVNVNIPLALAKVFVTSDADAPKINGKDIFHDIDIGQILALVDKGVIGKIVEIKSANGDVVEVWVE